MGCSGCGGSIIRGTLSAHKNIFKTVKRKRVKGYSGSGVIKSAKRLKKEAGIADVAKANKEAAESVK